MRLTFVYKYLPKRNITGINSNQTDNKSQSEMNLPLVKNLAIKENNNNNKLVIVITFSILYYQNFQPSAGLIHNKLMFDELYKIFTSNDTGVLADVNKI